MDPSMKIKTDLAALLNGGLKFPARLQTFDSGSAPNPCLKIDGLGVVGLPLSERDAKAIISRSARLVDSDIWEMSSEKVHFSDTVWDEWVQSTVVPLVCGALAANQPPTPPECKLCSLLIQGSGSECFSYEDDMRTPGNFGSISIVLPSEFTGGQLSISHQGPTKHFDFAKNSIRSTSVLGSYTGLTHKLKPICSGYKMSLSYNLICVSEPYPSLPDVFGPLNDILLSWMQAVNRPKQLAYVFEHNCTTLADLLMNPLEGSGNDTLFYLIHIARSLCFHVYLANIELQLCSIVDVMCKDLDGDEVEELEFRDKSEVLKLMYAVDLDGLPVCIPNLKIERNAHLFGDPTLDDPWSAKLDKLSKESPFSTNKCLTFVHQRSSLLLWPENEHVKVTVGDVYSYACSALAKSHSVAPEGKQRILVDHLMDYCVNQAKGDDELSGAIRVLRETAKRWNDVPLLLRAVKACKADLKITIMGIEGFLWAYLTFGYEVMRTLLSDVIKNDSSNLLRWNLVDGLAKAGLEAGDQEIQQWCSNQQDEILRSLKQPVSSEQLEVDWLVSQIKLRGIQFLCDVIVPQLRTLDVSQSFSLLFLRQLYKDKDSFGTSSTLGLVQSQLVTYLVLHNKPPFKKEPSWSDDRVPDIDLSMKLIKLGVDTANFDSCSAVFASVRVVPQDGPLKQVVSRFYSEMTAKLDEYVTAELEGLSVFHEFFQDIVVSLLENLAYYSPSNDIRMLVVAVGRATGVPFLKENLRIYNAIEKYSDMAIYAIRSSVNSLRPPHVTKKFGEQLSRFMSQLIDHFDMSKLRSKFKPAHLELLELCFELDMSVLCERLLLRLLDPPPGIDASIYLKTVLSPFLPKLQKSLIKQGINVTAQPFGYFYSHVIQKFVKIFVGERPFQTDSAVPPSELMQSCKKSCDDCRSLRCFLRSSCDKETEFAKSHEVRSHLEDQVWGLQEWGVTYTTIKIGNPHTLKITKPSGLTLQMWNVRVQEATRLMDAVGGENHQKQLLGSDYEWVITAISQKEPQPTVNASAKKRLSSASPSGSRMWKRHRTDSFLTSEPSSPKDNQ